MRDHLTDMVQALPARHIVPLPLDAPYWDLSSDVEDEIVVAAVTADVVAVVAVAAEEDAGDVEVNEVIS